MPTYEYKCDSCDHQFEEFQSMSDKALEKCPECKKKKLRRLFGTGAAVLFKGSGFYETDYRSESYKTSAKADKEATAPKPADTNGKTGASDAPAAPSGDKGKNSGAKSPKSKD